MVSGSIDTRPPPSIAGVTNAPSASVRVICAPATTPGSDSGNVTLASAVNQLAPRSAAASRTLGSIPASEVKIGNTANGRKMCTIAITTPVVLNTSGTPSAVRPSRMSSQLTGPLSASSVCQP
nr:hypothetical protein [Pseudonocardia acaciae]